jgi:hypothetical protein
LRIASTDDLKRWAAFLDLCAMLTPKRVGAVPFRDDMDWELIVRLASEHMASPAVWRAVANAAAAPQEVKAYFAAIHHMNARRNQMILEGLEELLARFDQFRIKYVLLKGGASVASGLYDDPAERMLTDIDVLVATEQIKQAETALRSNGYKDATPIQTGSRRWFRSANHHLPPLVPPTGGFSIELHTSLVPWKKFSSLLPPAAILERAFVVQWNGRSIFVPHPTDCLFHNIVHSQLIDDLSYCWMIELRQMRELAMFVASHCDDVDWIDVERRFSTAGYRDVLAEQAVYSQALMGVAFPVGEHDAQKAMNRLRTGVMNSQRSLDADFAARPHIGDVWAKLGRIYVRGFVRNPKLAINLLNPFWWPEIIRGIRARLRA